ncbi:hypothetical protein ACPCSE_29415 [Streptomyces cellulosae]
MLKMTTDNLRALLADPGEEPVLYVHRDEDTGKPDRLQVRGDPVSGAEYCGKDLGSQYSPPTCRRLPDHGGVCSPAPDRGSKEFNDAWAEYFVAHPEVLASWNHQNGYWPPGHLDAHYDLDLAQGRL